jgi:ubiquinone/menaquinone biosynthesis C-methylase UbiE
MTTETVEDTRGAWDAIAEGYDATNTPTQMWLGNEALRRAGLRAGMHFLDVAAGSGALAIPAARLGARVLATDQSPAMLKLLRRRADEEGLAIETRAMDGHALDLDDASFDMAGSQFGVMLFPDMPKGVAEMARVVRPGGRVVMIAYGDPHAIDFIGFFVAAVRMVRPDFNGPPDDPPPLPFQLQDPGRVAREMQAAGLTEVRVETITETTAFRSGNEFWEWVISSNPLPGDLLDELRLSAGERDAVRQALEGLVRARAGGDGTALLSNSINIGIGLRAEGRRAPPP